MKPIHSTVVAGALGAALLAGCKSAERHTADVHAGQERSGELTVGRVQSQVAKGMAGSQVVEALGSPNIVTTDENGREVWVYDRFASEVTYSESSGGVWLILGVIGGSSGATSRSQRTLTVIVKFDESKRVREVAYHSTRF